MSRRVPHNSLDESVARPPSEHKETTANRNFVIDLPADLVYEYFRFGVGWGGSTTSVKNGVSAGYARLAVSNPQRQHKPADLAPTARTLVYERRIYPVHERMIGDATTYNGYRVISPDIAGVNAEWNAHYLDSVSSVNDEKLRTEAVIDALTAVKDQKWNAGVMLAESSGVAQMATDAMRLVARTRQLIRNGDFRAAYRHFRKKTNYMSYPEWRKKHWRQVRHVKSVRKAQDIPKGWLYYHFGIKPTIDDISSAVDAFAQRKTDAAFQYGGITHGYARETTKETRDIASGDHPQGYSFNVTYEKLRSVRVAIRVQPKPSFLARLSGLGVTNPPEAAWNAIPFSWLVDYFTSFGDWLSVLDTGLGWQFADTWSESWRTVQVSTLKPQANSRLKIKYSYPSHNGYVKRKTLNRVVRTDLYGPMGSIVPQLKRKGPSAQQYSNLLSVVASSMKMTIRP